MYSPPGALSNSRNFLGPEPYPSTIARPDTTFTDLIQVVGLPRDGKGKAPDPTGENPFRDPGHPI